MTEANLAGPAAFASWVAARGRERRVVIVDAAVPDAAMRLLPPGPHTERIVLDRPAGLPAVAALARRLAGADLVVGIGGGTVMDLVKLATAVQADDSTLARLGIRQRAGLVVLPPSRSKVPLVLVPSTIGTGSEAGSNACLAVGSGKRLVTGPDLCADLAVHDPAITASAPAALLREGVLEALFRTVSPVIGDPAARPAADARSLVAAEQLVTLGGTLVRQLDRTGRSDGALRTQISALSAFSHSSWLHAGRDPFCATGWYVANELSCAAGTRKMQAIAALLPALWQAVAEGDRRWGDPDRLALVWSRIAAAAGSPLPADPASGIAALTARWGVDSLLRVPAGLVDTVARRTVHHWGAGLPMLGALRHDDVRRLLNRAVGPPATRAVA